MGTEIDLSELDAILEFLCNSPVVPTMLAGDVLISLVVIRAYIIDHHQEIVEDGILQVAENGVRKVESILFSFDLNKMNEYMALELCLQLYFFLKLEWNMPDLMYVERPKLSPYYPKTSAFVFIDHLLENLEELVKETDSLTHPFNCLIVSVQRELRFWYSDLIEISSNPPSFLKEVIQTITELAYDIEYVIDLFLVGDVPSLLCVYWLRDILKEFENIEQERMTKEDEEEDFKANKRTIIDMLLGTEEQLNIITIVGSDDSSYKGKKAFAKELFNFPSVIDHFDSRVCCSLEGDERSILLEILGHLVDLSDVIRSKEDDELTKLVYECLEGKRFLFVIYDAWTIDDWVCIRECFPDSHNGSRIVLATNSKEFIFRSKSMSTMQSQRPLNDTFQESLFQKVSFPNEMLEVGIKIAKRCKPESMNRVLPLLLNIRKTVNQWEEVANTLGSRVFGWAGSQEERILDLTCILLSDQLRSCFLYMGVFTYGSRNLVSELIRLWIAEGFIKHTSSQSLECTAEDYFADLMARNLLVTIQENYIGGGKCCDIVPQVRTFLARKVKEVNFVQIESFKGPNYSSSPTVFYQRRLVIDSTWDEFKMLKPAGPFVHSLFYFNWTLNDPIDISIIYNNFKFLRILNFLNINIGESFVDIGVLVLLRYLAVSSFVDFIPPSVANLQNLETLIFRQSGWEVVKVPDFILDMTKLRHFDVMFSSSSFNLEPHRLENSSSILDNLQSFSKPILSYGDDMGKLLRKLLGIRELECVFLDSWDDAIKCNRFPVLEFLNKLISLKVEYDGERKYPCEFNFPSNLKKLTLYKFRMPWSEILQLSMLNNLEALELMDNAIEGERWQMEDHVVFPKLKFLRLWNIEVEYWSATHDQFPHLEHLVVDSCKKLVEIPQDFACISTIRMIQVEWSTPSAENSVRLIQEQHMKHWGHDELKIFFNGIIFNNQSKSE